MSAIVLYHGGCADGFCSAWIASKCLAADTEFVPVSYGEPPPDVAGKDVYILDFSYPRAVMVQMAQSARSVLCLDHHQTAEQNLRGLEAPNLKVVFDQEHSGAWLAWDWFNRGKHVPWLVRYVEDRDTWKFLLHESRAVNATIRSHPMDFKVWDDLHGWAEYYLFWLIDEGKAILRYQEQIVAQHVRQAHMMRIGEHEVKAVNATVCQSEIAGALAIGQPFAAVYTLDEKGLKFSLRSDEAGLDVAQIAEQFGGGGHRHAAGFREEHS